MSNRSLKKALGLRLSEDAIQLLREMAQRNGLSQAGVMELAIREKAKREGISGARKAADAGNAQGGAAAAYSQSLANGGELTAASAAQEPLHDYSAGEVAAMEAGEFQANTQANGTAERPKRVLRGYGKFAGRGRSVDDFLQERRAEASLEMAQADERDRMRAEREAQKEAQQLEAQAQREQAA